MPHVGDVEILVAGFDGAIDQNHGDAFFLGLLQGRDHGVGVHGVNDQRIHALGNQVFQLRYLRGDAGLGASGHEGELRAGRFAFILHGGGNCLLESVVGYGFEAERDFILFLGFDALGGRDGGEGQDHENRQK